jgi:hypothetical protein
LAEVNLIDSPVCTVREDYPFNPSLAA